METPIQLERMSILDKLRTLELIWDDLLRTPEAIPSPGWHADVLRAREHRVKEGSSSFSDWPEAKQRIRERAN